ncbi:bifunctional hydroxymethylpyrimidine kinase/phosphomethylpyrimidine kinase [Limosilactobacillus caecicola]|uniref:bifunctional hydroxymethylpyrimidine kinase/phosphomethylpyrimidine kinase n=1 Tax=Limosilactobacillus caecicola TaxID=2941332 RepID=UPI00203DCE5A|nr:bifunctional hydroxymethylpyrimidine kinase/phosphomethylpyrimidine kinase [Limosilactobacillus caecicola]
MYQALSIAGYDSNGSAGLTADLHTFFSLNVYGLGVLTSAVAENTQQITAAHDLPASFIHEELTDAAEFHVGATKTGMLSNVATIQTVAHDYNPHDFGPLIVDPVILTKQEDRLLEPAALGAMKELIIPQAMVITPNYFEAQELVGKQFENEADLQHAAHEIQSWGVPNIVIKGRHLTKQATTVHDFVLLENGTSFWLSHPIVKAKRLNGAGDSFAAAITANLAKGNNVEQAIRSAHQFVQVAIAHPLSIAKHFGPLNYWAGQTGA